jgi:hypothetical protein
LYLQNITISCSVVSPELKYWGSRACESHGSAYESVMIQFTVLLGIAELCFDAFCPFVNVTWSLICGMKIKVKFK